MRTHKLGTLLLFLSLAIIAAIFNSYPALAQQTVTSATLRGRVEDARGGVVRGAILTATNLETNQKYSATTDSEGHYRFPYLQVGSYKLEIEARGFAPLAKQLTVTVGQALDLPLTLDVAGRNGTG